MRLSLNNAANLFGRDVSSASFRTVSSFDSRSYYSASDVRFEFGNLPVDDIAGISWKLIEPKKFHYGYDSRTATHMSAGQRIVQGQIITNFRDPGQMRYILKAIRGALDTPEERTAYGEESLARQLVFNTIAGGAPVSDEKLRSLLDIPNSRMSKDNILEQLRATSSTPRRAVMQAFRDALWGIESSSDVAAALPESPFVDRPQTQVKLDCGDSGFDIRMIFGEPDTAGRSRDSTGRLNTNLPQQLGAVVLISGVQIMSEGFEVSETGEPVRLVYDYIAVDAN